MGSNTRGLPEFIAATLPLPQQWAGKAIWRRDLGTEQVSDGLRWKSQANLVTITAAELASPPAAYLADTSTIFAVGHDKFHATGVGVRHISGNAAQPKKRWIDLLTTESAALWDDRAGAGLTVTVDTSVLFEGRPTLRLDIPASSSGTYRVGTSAASVVMPYNWDGKQLAWAVMSSNLSAVSSSSVFLGDGTFTNFNSHGGQSSTGNVPEANWVANEWMVFRGTAVTPTGSPTHTGVKRLRVNFTVSSVGTATSVWIGRIGISPQKRPTIILSVDDGYRSGYTFLAPLLRYYKVPASFGIDQALVGGGNYMTEGMIRELHADPSDLFEFVTHGYNNTNVTTAGDAPYVAQQVACRAYLRSLGINGDGPNHHPWVQSVYNNNAQALMQAEGFLSARMGGSTPKSMHDAWYDTGHDKRVMQQLNCISVTTGVSLATAQNAITTACTTEGYGVAHVNAHDFAAADAASPPTWSYDKMVDLVGWMAAQRDAGTFDIKCWGRWYADATGRFYAK